MELLIDGKGEWSSTKKNPYESIAIGSLIKEAKMWFYFIGSVLLPSKHLTTVHQEETILLYALLKGYKINVGKIIENSILNYYRSKYRGLKPHPTTITRLCILGGVKGTWEEEERCPKTSPLTLTGITKAPSNKGKKKLQEVEEEEERRVENPKQAMVLSIDRIREERQKSLRPGWNLSPNVRVQLESSWKLKATKQQFRHHGHVVENGVGDTRKRSTAETPTTTER